MFVLRSLIWQGTWMVWAKRNGQIHHKMSCMFPCPCTPDPNVEQSYFGCLKSFLWLIFVLFSHSKGPISVGQQLIILMIDNAPKSNHYYYHRWQEKVANPSIWEAKIGQRLTFLFVNVRNNCSIITIAGNEFLFTQLSHLTWQPGAPRTHPRVPPPFLLRSWCFPIAGDLRRGTDLKHADL